MAGATASRRAGLFVKPNNVATECPRPLWRASTGAQAHRFGATGLTFAGALGCDTESALDCRATPCHWREWMAVNLDL